MKFKLRPALYFLIPYLLGIIVGGWVSIPLLWLWFSVLLCLIGSIVTRQRRRYLCYGLLHLAVFAGGMLRLETASHSPIPPHFYDQPISFSGTTTYQPERGEAWDACYAAGELQLLSDPTQQVSAKFLIRFQKLVPLRYGRHITLTGVLRQPQGRRNPGGFDYRAYLARQDVVGIIDAKGLLRIDEQGGFLLGRWIEALRIRTERVIDHIYTASGTAEPSLHAQLLKGILLGKRSDLPTETLDIFRNSGTFHVLAVSGLHVGLVAMFCYFGFGCFRLPRKILCLLTILAVLIYASLVGFRPSVFRASLMAILFLFSTLIDRDADLFNLLAFAALVLLLLNPLQMWDVGFQLSFVAVAAIVYFVPKMERPLRRLWENEQESVPVLNRFRNAAVKWLVLSYLVTLAAQIGTTPLIAYHFFRAYPLGFVVGPFAVGLVSLIVAVGMVSVCVGFIWLPLAKLIALLNHAVISVFLALIGTFGQTWGVVKLAPPTFGFFVLYIGLFLGIAHWRYAYKQWRVASLIGLSVLAIWVWDTAFHEKGKLLEVVTLDVGQGDAAFVRFPDNRMLLIDGGIQRTYYDEKKQRRVDYDVGKRVIEPYLDFRGIRKLDMVVLTHPDIDHGGGLGYILENFEVGRVLGISDMPLNSETHQRLHTIVNANNIPYAFPFAGEIELTPTAMLNLLHPIDAVSTNLLDQDKNDDSLVIKLTYYEVDVLFTGDIGKKAESRLIASGQDLRSEILKVPHHGSRTSSSAAFIDAVQPRYAIFSLGQNSLYQFPHADVVARYRARGCVQVRTDEFGAITLRTDGKRCWIEGVE
ncbi:DNA internalization-related competence protein ComEC/Rec2 [Candidatus Poribacteria bacterium]|nr:DNA internalization-related competence protein ComEC/Rec2 [Candidatus Poribacteria bacterium]MYB02368.1 DNA internalization-related competence protein ComEC/Rec2 [Candidatus Poribacteria bacterium]